MITRCKDCIYYEVDAHNLTQGLCRRHSPKVLLAPVQTHAGVSYNIMSAWPPVKAEAGCGEGLDKLVSKHKGL